MSMSEMFKDNKNRLLLFSALALFVLMELFNIISAWMNGDLLAGHPAPILILSYLFVSIFEETVFRILPVRFFAARLVSKKDEVMLVVLTSLAFGLFHLVNIFSGASVLFTLLQIIFASSIGSFFCVLFLRIRSPLLIVALHFAHDVITGFNSPDLTRGVIYSGAVTGYDIITVLLQSALFLCYSIWRIRNDG